MKRISTSSNSLDSGDEAGKTTTTDPCSRHTRAVAGAGGQLQTTGSQPIVSATACPTSFLPEAPVPEQPVTLARPRDARTPWGDLHAPTTAADLTAHST